MWIASRMRNQSIVIDGKIEIKFIGREYGRAVFEVWERGVFTVIKLQMSGSFDISQDIKIMYLGFDQMNAKIGVTAADHISLKRKEQISAQQED